MRKHSDAIKRKLALLPDKPGVYIMHAADGEVIYVGKAKSLKNRVHNYFGKTLPDRKTERLVANIADFEYIITTSEHEAFVLEANLIKEHKPHYNVMLKDDKQYPFILITDEPYPRLEVTRQMKRDGGRYFGPYTDAGGVRRTMRAISWIFPLRSCQRDIPLGPPPYDRACMNYQMGKCLGPCIGAVSHEDYADTVRHVVRFLSGHSEEIIELLEQQMAVASEELAFEKAAKLRDRIEAIRRMMRSQNVFFADGRDRDVIGIYREGDNAAVTVLRILGGKLLNRETYDLDNTDDSDEPAMLAAFLQQYYAERIEHLPHRILLQIRPDEFDSLNEWLHNKLQLPQRGDNKRLILIARENAFNHIEERKLRHMRKTARTVYPVQELKDKLGLSRLPRRMACFDISTIQGTDTVSSMVFFENGKPKKKHYRHFVMKTVDGQDDFASMAETLERYLSAPDKHERADLLVIDGGKGQLNRAWEIVQRHNEGEMEMISLAKRVEEVYLPGQRDSVLLPRNSSALRLLVAIRDEAHRFAITFHRKRRSARTLASELDDIPGIGKDKKFALLKALGSVERIRNANEVELARVPGVGEKTARSVLQWLREHPGPGVETDGEKS